jgi:hypothetical protein
MPDLPVCMYMKIYMSHIYRSSPVAAVVTASQPADERSKRDRHVNWCEERRGAIDPELPEESASK